MRKGSSAGGCSAVLTARAQRPSFQQDPPITSNAWTSNPYSRQRSRLDINLGLSLTASPARLRVSQERTALRSVAHSTMRPHRGVAPGIPVCPPREHVPPRPLRRIALWSVLARGQNDPAASSVSRVRSGRLPARVGQTYRLNTHMSVEAYPPDGPQISPRQGSQNFSARAGSVALGGPVRERGPVSGAALGKLLRPASRRLRRP